MRKGRNKGQEVVGGWEKEEEGRRSGRRRSRGSCHGCFASLPCMLCQPSIDASPAFQGGTCIAGISAKSWILLFFHGFGSKLEPSKTALDSISGQNRMFHRVGRVRKCRKNPLKAKIRQSEPPNRATSDIKSLKESIKSHPE